MFHVTVSHTEAGPPWITVAAAMHRARRKERRSINSAVFFLQAERENSTTCTVAVKRMMANKKVIVV